MADFDEPLDFELEDEILISPAIAKKKKKVIGLDDLLTDYYKEKNRLVKEDRKRLKTRHCDSDEDVDARETAISDYVNKCQEDIHQISGDDEMPLWGLQFFRDQRTFPELVFPELKSCTFLQCIMENELKSVIGLTAEDGETFLEGLLVDRWLLKLVQNCGRVEKCLGTWTFNLMLYSSKEVLRTAACDFWSAILSPENEVDIHLEWSPSYSDLIRALEAYGFVGTSASINSSDVEMHDKGAYSPGPPQNMISWIKFIGDSCHARSKHLILSTSEAEDLVCTIICLFLDRQLIGLTRILLSTLLSVINIFTDSEFSASCYRIADSLASRLPRDINCLRVVGSIAGTDIRSKHLRSEVAYQFLIPCSDLKVDDQMEILRKLIAVNLKDKDCDLLNMYISLTLVENWLQYAPCIRDKQVIHEMWGLCLRNCSCQLTSSDLRSYASKVRSKASYLLQGISID